jgi:pimeloyl-ACP methyl ester carboxylesterase
MPAGDETPRNQYKTRGGRTDLAIAGALRERIARALTDPEIPRQAPRLSVRVRLLVGDAKVDFAFAEGALTLTAFAEPPDIEIAADEEAWRKVLQVPPPPSFHAFTALDMANPAFAVRGEGLLIAQARPALERIFELIATSPVAPAASVRRDLSQIRGGYTTVRAVGQTYEIYCETAGSGLPVLLLHTAGADSRQYLDQMSDVGLAAGFALTAADLPFHGRSMPPRDWDGAPYTLTAALYSAWCAAIIEQVIGAPCIVVGGSMGAAMALHLAAERPDLVLGAVAVEPPFRAKGRINPFQNNVAVHGGLHNGAFVRGLMSPESPQSGRRRASWIYSQGAPGIYPGDLAFYSLEFDGAVTAPRIDPRHTPVALLSGSYDYSASPADGRQLEALIPGAYLQIMPSLGHFPMCEHADLFRPYLWRALQHVVGAASLPSGASMSSAPSEIQD